MTDIIDGGAIVSIIASSTTNYLGQFSPIFALMGGILLAVGILYILIGFLSGNRGYFEDRDGM